MANVLCFDLEGPLSPQDNAYELMGLFGNGRRVFEVISRYDDVLTIEGRRNYEPGDTLSLIIPFLVCHGITEGDIARVSKRARIVDGVKDVLSVVGKTWRVYVISTSYQQHAFNIARQVGIPQERVHATKLPLDEFYRKIRKEDMQLVAGIEEKIINRLCTASDVEVKRVLDAFYQKLEKTSFSVLGRVRVVGGVRKLSALKQILAGEKKKLSEVVVVGDSITDFRMLEAVKNAGGVAVVFNGNAYALPHGNVGLAGSSMMPLLIILDAFAAGGAENALSVARMWHRNQKAFLSNPAKIPSAYIPDDVLRFLVEHREDVTFLKPHFSSLTEIGERGLKQVIRLHANARKTVRGEAGKLG